MAKDIGDYSAQELAELGKKVVETRQKESGRNKEKNKVISVLYQAWKDGKVKIEGLPNPK